MSRGLGMGRPPGLRSRRRSSMGRGGRPAGMLDLLLGVHAGGVRSLQYERWTLWGWIVRVLLTLLVIGTAIQLIALLVG